MSWAKVIEEAKKLVKAHEDRMHGGSRCRNARVNMAAEMYLSLGLCTDDMLDFDQAVDMQEIRIDLAEPATIAEDEGSEGPVDFNGDL